MTNLQLAEKIESQLRPEEDWWKGDTQDVITDTAFVLLNAGIEWTTVSVILNNIITAIREEYGE